MYAETVNNPKLKLLAFEDRWHYVAVLCMKSKGILDRTDDLRDRLIAAELGLTRSEAEEVRRRLMEVDLVLADWQPKGWSKYQYESDNAAARMRKHRQQKQQPTKAKRNGDVTVTNSVTIDTDTDTDTEKKKTRASALARQNPWGAIPADVDPKAWTEWTGYKAGRPKPETIDALRNLLANHPPAIQRKAVAHSIANGYAGLFPEKFANEASSRTTRKPGPTVEDKRRALERRARGEPVGEPDGDVRGSVYEGVRG